MRLIDADSLLQVIRKNIPKNPHDEYQEGQEIGLSMAVEMVCNQPTVDAEPIRHGHWIKINNDNDRWKCSCCGFSFIGFNGLHETFAEMCDYCPCCGAKMDEEMEEDEYID